MSEDKRPRGRPRPDDVVARDNEVYTQLEHRGPLTRNQLADHTGIGRQLVYLSLDRLRGEGRVRRCLNETGATVWTTDVEGSCP